jgi:hypothetical protein
MREGGTLIIIILEMRGFVVKSMCAMIASSNNTTPLQLIALGIWKQIKYALSLWQLLSAKCAQMA